MLGRGEQATRDPSDQATEPRGAQLSGAGERRAGNQSSEQPGPGTQRHPALRFWGEGNRQPAQSDQVLEHSSTGTQVLGRRVSDLLTAWPSNIVARSGTALSDRKGEVIDQA